MTPLEEIRDLYAYHRWANGRVLEAAGRLPVADFDRDLRSSFPSVRETLAHVLASDWVWLSRWRGNSPTARPQWDVATHAALSARWREVEADQRRFLEGLVADDLERTIAYRQLSGTAFSAPLGQLLRHVVNHATYHRGQAVTLLRQLGAEPPPTDLVLFHRERGA